jgi:8-oxo-dGTP diphosphatase
MDGELIIDLVRHMKAKNRAKWDEDDEVRPLTKLGRRQAEMHAATMAEGEPIVAVYSSPALRCRETVRPLAERLGLTLLIEPLLAEMPPILPIGAETPLLTKLREAHPAGGRIVACGHADTIPAFLESLDVRADAPLPGLLKGFGGWYRVQVTADDGRLERIEAPGGFPKD